LPPSVPHVLHSLTGCLAPTLAPMGFSRTYSLRAHSRLPRGANRSIVRIPARCQYALISRYTAPAISHSSTALAGSGAPSAPPRCEISSPGSRSPAGTLSRHASPLPSYASLLPAAPFRTCFTPRRVLTRPLPFLLRHSRLFVDSLPLVLLPRFAVTVIPLAISYQHNGHRLTLRTVCTGACLCPHLRCRVALTRTFTRRRSCRLPLPRFTSLAYMPCRRHACHKRHVSVYAAICLAPCLRLCFPAPSLSYAHTCLLLYYYCTRALRAVRGVPRWITFSVYVRRWIWFAVTVAVYLAAHRAIWIFLLDACASVTSPSWRLGLRIAPLI